MDGHVTNPEFPKFVKALVKGKALTDAAEVGGSENQC
jgi:hypothetical protein